MHVDHGRRLRGRNVDRPRLLVVVSQHEPADVLRHLDEELVARAHSLNAKVIAWTADDADQWETLRLIGVDGICTNRIAELATYRL